MSDTADPEDRRLRALITRPRENAEAVAAALTERGIEVQLEPLLDIRPIEHEPIDLAGVQAVLLTSPAGARAFAEATAERGMPVYAVGDATADIARERGFAEVASAQGDGVALADLAIERLQPGNGALLHASGRTIAGGMTEKLEAAGFAVRRVELYAARPAAALSPETIAALRAGMIDLALFFSPRTAATFVRLVREAGVAESCARVEAFCISPAAAEAAGDVPWAAVHAAASPDQAGIVAAIDGYLARGREPETPEPEMPAATPAAPAMPVPAAAPPPRWIGIAAVVALLLAAAAALASLALWGERARMAEELEALRAERTDGSAIASLQGRAGQIEARVTDIGAAAARNESRLNELTAQREGLTAKLESAIEERAALVARLAAAEQRIAETDRVAAGLREELDRTAATAATARQQMQAEADGLRRRIEEVAAIAREAAQDRTAAMLLSLSQIRAALGNGQPFAAPLAALRRLAADDPAVAPALAGWTDRAEAGIPTVAALRERFAEPAATAVGHVRAETGEGWLDKAIGKVGSLVSIRKVGEDVPGSDDGAIVARAEAKLRADDLAGAVAEIGALQGEAAAAFAPWLADARARLAAREALPRLEAAIVASGGGG